MSKEKTVIITDPDCHGRILCVLVGPAKPAVRTLLKDFRSMLAMEEPTIPPRSCSDAVENIDRWFRNKDRARAWLKSECRALTGNPYEQALELYLLQNGFNHVADWTEL